MVGRAALQFVKLPGLEFLAAVAATLAEASALKSPLTSACVGTQALTDCPRTSRFHSWFHQNHTLFLITGPLTLYPQSLRRSSALPVLLKFENQSLASSASLRPA